MSGISAAPLSKLDLAKIEVLESGEFGQTVDFGQDSRGGNSVATEYSFPVDGFCFYQNGSVRLKFSHRNTNLGYASYAYVYRLRGSIETQLAYFESAPLANRVLDIDVMSGDIIFVKHRCRYVTSILSDVEILTNGQRIWPFVKSVFKA
jgi:hypothetical protein